MRTRTAGAERLGRRSRHAGDTPRPNFREEEDRKATPVGIFREITITIGNCITINIVYV